MHLANLFWGLRTVLSRGRPKILFCSLAGIGDDIMASCLVHEFEQRYPEFHYWLMTNRPELFQGCSRDKRLIPHDERFNAAAKWLGCPVIPVSYTKRTTDPNRDFRPPAHVLELVLASAGIRGKVQLRGHLMLQPAELDRWKSSANTIVLHTSTKVAWSPIPLKDYPPEEFQKVADCLLQKGFRLIQVGSPKDPTLTGAEDLRGKTNLREVAALLAGARLFLGLEGGLMHLARAVECPGVIIYSGRQSPLETGYRSNTNVFHSVDCAPCWKIHTCDRGFECLTRIFPQSVVDAVEHQLDRGLGCSDPEESDIDEVLFGKIRKFQSDLGLPFWEAPK